MNVLLTHVRRLPGKKIIISYSLSSYEERTTLSMFACHQTAQTRCSPLMLEFWPHEAPLKPVTVEPVNRRGSIGLKKKDYEKILAVMVVVFSSNNFISFSFLIHTRIFLKSTAPVPGTVHHSLYQQEQMHNIAAFYFARKACHDKHL